MKIVNKKLILLLSIIITFPFFDYFVLPNLKEAYYFEIDILEKIRLEISPVSSNKTKLIAQNIWGELDSLDRMQGIFKRAFITNLYVALDDKQVENLKELKVSLGEQSFLYSREEFFTNWSQESIPGKFSKMNLWKAPSQFKSQSYLNNILDKVPVLSKVINWSKSPEDALVKVLQLIFFVAIVTVGLVLSRKVHVKLESSTLSSHKFEKFYYFSICSIILSITLYYSKLGIDFHHQGFILNAALRFSEGKTLFKEIFYHYGPLSAQIHFLTMLIGGKTLLAVNATTAIFYTLIAYVYLLISRRFLNHYEAIISLILWILMAPFFIDVFLPWSSVYSLFFSMLSLHLLLNYLEKKQMFFLFCSASCISLCFWCRQSVGPIIFMALLILLLIKHIKTKNTKLFFTELCVSSFGIALVSIFYIVWLHLNNSLPDWWIQNMTAQMEWAFKAQVLDQDVTHSILKDLLPINVWSIFPLISVYLILISMRTKKHIKDDLLFKDFKLISLCLFGLASWPQYFPIPCNRHHFWAATPMILCFWIYIFRFIIPYLTKINKNFIFYKYICVWWYACLMFSSISHMIWQRIDSGFNKLSTYNYTIQKPDILKGIKLDNPIAVQKLEEMDNFLKHYRMSNPKVSIVSEEDWNQMFLTFLSENKSPSPIPSALFDYGSLAQKYRFREKLNDFILREKPIVYSDKQLTIPGYKEYFHSYAPPIINSYFYIPD
jgi:hypothetical protein